MDVIEQGYRRMAFLLCLIFALTLGIVWILHRTGYATFSNTTDDSPSLMCLNPMTGQMLPCIDTNNPTGIQLVP